MKRSGDITGLIDKAFDGEVVKPYVSKGSIGASVVGNTCDALLSFALRGFPDGKVEPKMKRIFRDGHKLEDVVLKDMAKAGVHVMSNDPSTGKQWEWRRYGQLAVFKADGIIDDAGDAILVEIKSMNGDLHDKFRRVGVRVSHPYYYDQVQMGMGFSNIKKAIVVGYNKDNSTYWDEVVNFDPLRFSFLLTRIEAAIAGHATKIGRSDVDWRCRRCFKAEVCWKPDKVSVTRTIRTCQNSVADTSGGFTCKLGIDVCEPVACTFYTQWKPKERI
jgi:hypothetical protein